MPVKSSLIISALGVNSRVFRSCFLFHDLADRRVEDGSLPRHPARDEAAGHDEIVRHRVDDNAAELRVGDEDGPQIVKCHQHLKGLLLCRLLPL